MPWSGDLLDKEAIVFFTKIKDEVRSVLDVGVGAGKYGTLLHTIAPSAEIHGVEIEKDFFTRFADVYKAYYTDVTCAPIQSWLVMPEIKYDLIIFGDVLEHLPKSEGVDVLNFFMYRCKYMWIQYPHHYIQNPSDIEGYLHEAHISVWTDRDFKMLDTNFKTWNRVPLTAVALEGFINHGVSINE